MPARPALALLLALAARALGGNPLVPHAGMADSHVHLFDGRFFMYATADFSPNNTGFQMRWWSVWTSADLVSWALADTLYPNGTAAKPSEYTECWATDGATHNGQYFFYLSTGPGEVCVVNSSTPVGPWEDSLKTPLLNASLGTQLGATFRDPCVFLDDDGAHYIIAGVFQYFVARLGEDRMSLAETPRKLDVINPTGPYGASTDDKPFMHKANGLYYLSWGCFYGVGASVYGPFTYVGSALDTAFIEPAFRMNNSGKAWYASEDYADRHGSFFSNAGGQTFYSSNDRSHSVGFAKNPSVFRDTVIGYVHYFANNSIAPVAINATGVGAYDARHYLEAENFFSLRGAGRKWHEPGGARFAVAGLAAGSALAFPHVRGAARAAALSIHAAADGAAPVRAALAVLFAGQAQLCAADLAGAREGAWADFKCALEPAWRGEVGSEDLHLTLTLAGEDGAAVLIDRINFLF